MATRTFCDKCLAEADVRELRIQPPLFGDRLPVAVAPARDLCAKCWARLRGWLMEQDIIVEHARPRGL